MKPFIWISNFGKGLVKPKTNRQETTTEQKTNTKEKITKVIERPIAISQKDYQHVWARFDWYEEFLESFEENYCNVNCRKYNNVRSILKEIKREVEKVGYLNSMIDDEFKKYCEKRKNEILLKIKEIKSRLEIKT